MSMNCIPRNVEPLPFGPLSRVAIGSTALSGYRDCLIESRASMLAFVMDAVATQGTRALDNPRSSTLVHEAGHAVVYAHFGIPVRRCEIWQEGEKDWTGFTTAGGKWRSDASTAPEDDLRQAICLMAGVIAERLFDSLNYRLASSVDEIEEARLLAFNVALKLGCEHESAAIYIDKVTTNILLENQSVVSKIAAVLDMKKKVWGEPLAALLAEVKRGDAASLVGPLKNAPVLP